MTKPSIFISYRIADTLPQADRLAAELQRTFGKAAIFFDRRTVEPGDTWDENIEAAIRNAQFVLVLVGEKWLTEQDEYGERRLSLAEDWVRREVEVALSVKSRTIPLLIDGASPPPKRAFRNLPTLAALASQQAAQLHTKNWDSDFGALVDKLFSKGIPRLAIEDAAIENATKPEFPAGYRDWVKNKLADISLLGLDSKDGRVATLRQVYVPAMTHSDAKKNIEDRSESVHLLARLGEQSLYVPGAPGSGKTTFCKWLALLVASGHVPDQHVKAPEKLNEVFPEALHGKMPVFCRLRDFYPKHIWQADVGCFSATEMERALAAWIDLEKPGGLDGKTFRRFMAEGRTMLMLDGFDEVASTVAVGQGIAYPRAALLEGLKAALPGWQAAGNRVLLTSRPYGLTTEEARSLALAEAPLVPLPAQLQQLFVQRWFATVSDQAASLSEALWAELRGRRDLADLRDNPMLLTAMCVKYQEGSRLPADVAEMYDALVSYVLHNRYHKQSAKVEAARRRLGVIALAMHCGRFLDETEDNPLENLAPEPMAEISFEAIDRALLAHNRVERLSNDRDFATLDIREDLLSNSGLFMPGGEQGAVFYHLSIQDFLAAERLDGIRAKTEEWLGRFASEPRWRQTFGFWFGRLMRPPGSPARALKAMYTLTGQLNVASLNSDPGPGLLWSDCLELAGAKLDDLGDYGQQFQESCKESLTKVKQPTTRARLFAVLGQLGLDERPGVGLDSDGLPDIAWVPVVAGRVELEDDQGSHDVAGFQIARYPVTWQQFEAFVTATDGYANRAWWVGPEAPTAPQAARWAVPNAPRETVSWHEAVAFSKWLASNLEKPVRLPTEEEWQLAATGGNPDNEYPWGSDIDAGRANCRDGKLYLGRTSPVGIYPQGERDSIADLAGNLWDWTATAVDADVVRDEAGEFRVLRGGSWNDIPGFARSADRGGYLPDFRNVVIGFRLVCSSPSLSTVTFS